MTKPIPLICLCLLLLGTVLSAQSPAGSFTLSAGIGIIPTYIGKTTHTDIPALSFQAGYRISNSFSLNGYFGYTAATADPKLTFDGILSKVSNKTTMFGLKAQLHRNFTDKIEIYGGSLLGYASFKRSETDMHSGEKVVRTPDQPTPYDPDAPQGRFIYSGFVGGKYWLTPKMSAYTEVGFGISLVNLGFSFRL